jgi:hypothetical protein
MKINMVEYSCIRNEKNPEAAGVAWWSSAQTPAREGSRSIPNHGNPFSTLGIGASPIIRDLAGRLCLIRKMTQLAPKKP